MLAEKGLKLDAAIEFRVDEAILLKRIETRNDQSRGRGEALRPDDNPETLKRRVLAYRDQSAPLITYYAMQGTLRTVDGMTSIPAVSAAIDRALNQGPASKKAASKKAVQASGKPVHGKVAKKAPVSKAKVSPSQAAAPKRRPAGRRLARPLQASGRGNSKAANLVPREVDDSPRNPLITRHPVADVAAMPDLSRKGRASCYRLRACPGASVETEISRIGTAGRQECDRGPHRRGEYSDQQARCYCTAIYPWDWAKKGS